MPPQAKATILCIEDEAPLLEELAEELESRGHNVLTAADGDAAEAILRETVPDVILCDVIMPRRDGFTLLRDLRAGNILSDQSAFIFLTALSDRAPQIEGLAAGAVDYLTKPVDLDLLHLKIDNTLAFMRRLKGETTAPVLEIHLSRREQQVLALVGQGARTGAIAVQLGISEHTVSQYVKELYRKLGINNRADAARIAIQYGLVKPE